MEDRDSERGIAIRSMRNFSFNIRGLGGSKQKISKRSNFQMCIQKTKMSYITKEKCIQLSGNDNIDWVHYGGEMR